MRRVWHHSDGAWPHAGPPSTHARSAQAAGCMAGETALTGRGGMCVRGVRAEWHGGTACGPRCTMRVPRERGRSNVLRNASKVMQCSVQRMQSTNGLFATDAKVTSIMSVVCTTCGGNHSDREASVVVPIMKHDEAGREEGTLSRRLNIGAGNGI